MKKIIYVQWMDNFGGVERITQDFERIFEHDTLFVLPLRPDFNGLKYKKTKVIRWHKRKYLLYLSYYFFARKHKEHIFHLQSPGARILLVTYLAGIRKIIYHFHGTNFFSTEAERLIWKYLHKRVQIIANSTFMKSVIKDKLKINPNISVIPNLIDTKKFTYRERQQDERFIITYAGRFIKGKNLHLIIETAKLLKYCNIEFYFYGEGEIKPLLIKSAAESMLNDVIRFYPFSENISGVYQKSNLFIFLSESESFGNVVAEAILTGLPALCNKIPSLQEMLDDDIFFIDKLDPLLIAKKIMWFRENYMEVLKRTKIMSKKMNEFLDNERIISSLKDIYEKMDNV